MTALSSVGTEFASYAAEDVHDVLSETAATLKPGRSSVRFTPGRAAHWNTSTLKTVAVVLMDVDEETKHATYEYLHNLQVITQRFRPLIITDGHELREIRKYGWLTEHLFDRVTFDAVRVDEAWPDMVVRRVLSTVKHFEAAAMTVVRSPGVTQEQHLDLLALVNLEVPYAAVAPR